MWHHKIHLIYFVVIICVYCEAEISTEDLFTLMTRRFGMMDIKINKMQNDMEKINTNKHITSESGTNAADMKKIIEDFKKEMETKFFALENNVLQRADTCVNDVMNIVLRKTNNLQLETKHNFGRVRASFSAEKLAIREALGLFNDRVQEVELKMLSFEKASWKGEKGEIGLPGINGLKGSKGEKGKSTKGDKGKTGSVGSPGRDGQRGIPGLSGSKGQKGERGSSGINGLKGSKGAPQLEQSVYFTATLTNKLRDIGPKETIVFNRVENQAGGGYNPSTGVFTAPVSGTYLFIYNVETFGVDKRANVDLMLDGNWKSNAIVETFHDGQDATSGNAAVLHASKGQRVWIQTARFNSTLYDFGTWRCTFTGVLLHAW